MNVFSRSYIDSLYEDYQQDATSLPVEWQRFFEDFNPDNEQLDLSTIPGSSSAGVVSSPTAHNGLGAAGPNSGNLDREQLRKVIQLQDRVDQLIRGYRVRGHLEAKIDPLGRPRKTNSELLPESYGLSQSDFQFKFSARTVDGQNFRTLEEIYEVMRATYCRSVGAQFMHIDDKKVRAWLQERMEGSQNRIKLNRSTQVRILTRLTDAVIFEQFMRKKFCLLYTSPSPRDATLSRMPSSA